MIKTRIILHFALLLLPACIIIIGAAPSSTYFRPRRRNTNHLGHDDNHHNLVTKSIISNSGIASSSHDQDGPVVNANEYSKRGSSRFEQLQAAAAAAARGGHTTTGGGSSSSTTSSSTTNVIRNANADIPNASALAGAIFFTTLQIIVTRLFRLNRIIFPPMLGCTILVFATLVLVNLLPAGSSSRSSSRSNNNDKNEHNLGDVAYQLLLPGSTLLAKWLPVMFVPGLAMLPLAPSLGGIVNGIKVLSVIVLGFGFSMMSTSYLSLGIRTMQGRVVGGGGGGGGDSAVVVVTSSPSPPPSKPFTQETLHFFFKGTIVFGTISMIASRQQQHQQHQHSVYTTPLRTVFMFFGTVLTYVVGARLPTYVTRVVHPLVTATVGTLLLTHLDATISGLPFATVLRTYKTGSLAPAKVGAGDILLFLLGPAVGCLSIAMYSRKAILADNLPVVIAAMLCSSIGGLFGTAWYIRLLNVGSSTMVRLSLLTRNVTTGLAIIITQMLDGDMAIAASVVVLTGIFAATVGRGLLDALQITDPVSRGLGMGAAGQGLGVAAMMPEVDAFPFAAINMVLTAICASAMVSIPAVKQSLVNIVSTGLK